MGPSRIGDKTYGVERCRKKGGNWNRIGLKAMFLYDVPFYLEIMVQYRVCKMLQIMRLVDLCAALRYAECGSRKCNVNAKTKSVHIARRSNAVNRRSRGGNGG